MSDLRTELQEIYDQRGRLTPVLVLDEARDPGHPLHSRFEWNDGVAAEKYRRQQAHELIRSVRVTYSEPPDEPPKTTRAFVSVRIDEDEENGGYRYEPARKVAEDEFTRKIVLAEMKRDWMQLRERYREFEEFVELVRSDVAAG